MFNEEGVAPRGESKRGQVVRWQSSAIASVLRNPSYMGLAAYGKTEYVERPAPLRLVRGRAEVPKKAKSGQRRRASDEWIRIPVPAIVSEDLFLAAKAQLDRNRAFAQRNRGKERYLLSGLTVCACCGYGYYGRTAVDKRGTRYAYYFCGSSGRSAEKALVAVPGCRNRGVRVEQLEAHVWQSVCALLEDPARVMREWSRRTDTRCARNEHDVQRADALRVVGSHERTLKRLVDAYEAGAIDLAELKTRTESVRARLTRARDELAALEKVLAEKHAMQLVVASVAEFGQRVRKGLGKLPWEERRRVIRTVVARIEINNDDVTVVFRVPAAKSTSALAPLGSVLGNFVDCVAGVRIPA
jgi:site-specific DNA recombinase